MTHFSELTKIRESKNEAEKLKGAANETISDPFFQKNLSDIFDQTDETCQNQPKNQELGPILGQNGDPDLIKLFPALLGQKKHKKNNRANNTRRILNIFLNIFVRGCITESQHHW